MKSIFSLVCFFISALSVSAGAQTFPNKPVKIIVPYAAGGTADTLARRVGQVMSANIGQPVIIDNRAGAAGLIGAAVLQNSPEDGYTIGMIATPHVATPADPSNPFDPAKLKAVALVAVVPSLICANPSVPAKSVSELVAFAHKNPGRLTYGFPGTYSAGQLAMEQFKQKAGMDIRGVPYRGGAPAFNDLLGGTIDLAISGASNCIPFMQAGKLNPIATTGAKRSEGTKDVPTLAESGYPDLQLSEWWGLFAPVNTPDGVVRQLNQEINRAIQDPDVQKFFTQIGAEPQNLTSDEFGAFYDGEKTKLKSVVESLGLK